MLQNAWCSSDWWSTAGPHRSQVQRLASGRQPALAQVTYAALGSIKPAAWQEQSSLAWKNIWRLGACSAAVHLLAAAALPRDCSGGSRRFRCCSSGGPAAAAQLRQGSELGRAAARALDPKGFGPVGDKQNQGPVTLL